MSATEKRVCGNCFSLDRGECMNGFGDVGAGDRCDQHRFVAEDIRETEAFKRFRVASGLPPRMQRDEPSDGDE